MTPPLWLVPQLPSATGGELWLGLHQAASPPGDVVLTIRGPAGVRNEALQIAWSAFEAGVDRFWYARTRIAGLDPDGLYELTATLVGAAASPSIRLRTLPAAVPLRGPHGQRLALLLGSCFYIENDGAGRIGRLQRRIAERDTPHLKLLCGDQVYLDLPWNERLPRDEVELRGFLLAKYLKNWGQGVEPGSSSGFGSFLRWGANLFMSDDHEFWNNFPNTAAYVRTSHNAVRRERLAEVTRALYSAFQTDYLTQGSTLQELHIGDPSEPGHLAIFALDGRFHRTDRRAVRGGEMTVLRQRLANLDGPAILVLSQPLFESPARNPRGVFGDAGIPDLDDYPELVAALLAAPHDVMILSGDIHGGRTATTFRGGRQLHEVIASPMSLCQYNRYHREGPAPTFPSAPISGVFGSLVTNNQPLILRDHVALLGVSRIGSTVVVDIDFWPLDDPSPGARPPTRTVNLF